MLPWPSCYITALDGAICTMIAGAFNQLLGVINGWLGTNFPRIAR